MKILLNKFGTTLTSRPAGKESFLALQSRLRDLKKNEVLEIDFSGVITFSPSWADEFITPLKKNYGSRVILLDSDNPSVKATLDILQQL